MATTRKARVPMTEQIRLINECRQSGMTDADWCRENDIAVSTFYNWVSRCRKAAADQIKAPNYGHCEIPHSKQDVVPIDIVSDHLPEQHMASQMHQTNLDNSHTIEVTMKDVTVRIRNDADPVLLARTLRLIREVSCQVISPTSKRSALSAAIQIIREELLFEKFCVKADVYRTPDNTSQITITHISLLYITTIRRYCYYARTELFI